MSETIREIYDIMTENFPLSLAESFDNCGLLVGDMSGTVSKILISLDITSEVIKEAAAFGAQLIISHHPVFFKGSLTGVNSLTPQGKCVAELIKHNIAAICMHTNADAAQGGVNDCLAKLVGIENAENLGGGESGLIGRIGSLKNPVDFMQYAMYVKKVLGADGLRVSNSGKRSYRVAVGGGSCGDMLPLAVKLGADTFITADVKRHTFKDAKFYGINLIDAGHFHTENPICQRFKQIIEDEFPAVDVKISEVNNDGILFI